MATEEYRDLGFGSAVAQGSRQRLLNRDGSFNVERGGLGIFRSLNPYHWLLTMSWWQFLALLTGGYLLANAAFALAYLACGPDALLRAEGITTNGRFWDGFFFSVQTFATIGYGEISPVGFAANLLVTCESVVGLLSVALATGLIFARFARPQAKIRFSRCALIAPYRGITAFEFRTANTWNSELIELECQVTFSRFENQDGQRTRQFYRLALERTKVTFFPLAWTIVHPIDETSPLRGETLESLQASQAEFFILITGIEETFSQPVHARTSYTADELRWGARFVNIFDPPDEKGISRIDVRRLDLTAPA